MARLGHGSLLDSWPRFPRRAKLRTRSVSKHHCSFALEHILWKKFYGISSRTLRPWPHGVSITGNTTVATRLAMKASCRCAAHMDGHGDDTVLLEEAGQRISLAQAYPHRGTILDSLCLYDYMFIVKLKRKIKDSAGWGEIQFDSAWPLSQTLTQILWRPGKHAVVCLDGHLSMDFTEEEEQPLSSRYVAPDTEWTRLIIVDTERRRSISRSSCRGSPPYKRPLVMSTTSGRDRKQILSRRVLHHSDNIQLLRRSAQDARRDARQWAASSREADPTAEVGGAEGDRDSRASYRADSIGTTLRLIDVLRNTVASGQVTA